MCGRFVSASSPEEIAALFDAAFDGEPLPANHNVAPTNDIYAVVAGSDGRAHVGIFHWGLVPAWAADTKVAAKMINARSETIATKPAYKPLLRRHRCIVPMDGFYEWQATPVEGARGRPAKKPMYVTRLDGEPLAVAGLWTTWRDKAAPVAPDGPGPWLHSCTVVTTSANATMAPIHDRMPVVLPRQAWDTWLDPSVDDVGLLSSLLVPAPDDTLVVRPVSTEVNDARNKGAHLIEPVS